MEQIDKDKMVELLGIDGFTVQEYDEIHRLYKKYVDQYQFNYSVGCDCSSSIMNLWRNLLDFYKKNQ